MSSNGQLIFHTAFGDVPIVKICINVHEANTYMKHHPDTSVIDEFDGMVLIAYGKTRQDLMAMLIANDPNGCYDDQDNLNEFGRILTYADLYDLATDQELIK